MIGTVGGELPEYSEESEDAATGDATCGRERERVKYMYMTCFLI
jgi:hypothetical protein